MYTNTEESEQSSEMFERKPGNVQRQKMKEKTKKQMKKKDDILGFGLTLRSQEYTLATLFFNGETSSKSENPKFGKEIILEVFSRQK